MTINFVFVSIEQILMFVFVYFNLFQRLPFSLLQQSHTAPLGGFWISMCSWGTHLNRLSKSI